MLHELETARDLLRADELAPALKCVARVKHIQKTLTEQWSVLATLTPTEYAQFRGVLGNASGFQSYQYRAVEFVLGNKNAKMMQVFESDAAATEILRHALESPSLYDEFLRLLARAGYPIPADVLDRDVTLAWTFHPELVPVFARHLREPRRALGRLRDLRGARRPRGQLPALALPAPEDGRAHHRLEDRHRRVERRDLPEARTRAHVLPRAVRRAHRDPGMTDAARH